jgi:large subunit ribosomal protein L5
MENIMRQPMIGKLIVNISVGTSGESLERAMEILRKLTGREPCKRAAKRTIKQFGIQKGEPIACMVTLRGGRASEFLRRAFKSVDNKLSRSNFDEHGNFSFGVKEHLDFPDVKYDPKLGVVGMDICVTIERRGWRVTRRRVGKGKIGTKHRLTREEAIDFIKKSFGVEIIT